MIKFSEVHDMLESHKGVGLMYYTTPTHKAVIEKDGEDLTVKFTTEGMPIGTLKTKSYKFASKVMNMFFARCDKVKVMVLHYSSGTKKDEEPEV